MSFTKKVVAGQTIAAADFAKFFGDHFFDFVKTGFEVTEGTGLIVDISAGTAYVKDADGYMYQIVSDATETTTLADDNTNYVFLHSDNGATYITASTTATVPDDAILLATVVCASGDVTSVVDARELNPLVTAQEFYDTSGKSGSAIGPSGTVTVDCKLNVFLDRVLTIKKVCYTVTPCSGVTTDSFTVSYSVDNSNFTTLRTITNIGSSPVQYTDNVNVITTSAQDFYLRLTWVNIGYDTARTLKVDAIRYSAAE